MSDTQARLDSYKAAEQRILQAQEVRGLGSTRVNAELAEVRKAIKDLETQLANEQRAATGQTGPVTLLIGFNPGFDGGHG